MSHRNIKENQPRSERSPMVPGSSVQTIVWKCKHKISGLFLGWVQPISQVSVTFRSQTTIIELRHCKLGKRNTSKRPFVKPRPGIGGHQPCFFSCSVPCREALHALICKFYYLAVHFFLFQITVPNLLAPINGKIVISSNVMGLNANKDAL